MKSEKTTLIIIFTIFFLLAASLIYLMIKNDIKKEDAQKEKMSQPRVNNAPENSWPKVEIETRK